MTTIPRFPISLPAKAAVAGLAAVVLAAGWVVWQRPGNPVPAGIRASVGFRIYYPASRNLPAGYTLDSRSFRQPEAGVVVFQLNNGQGQHLIFSEEAKPSGDVVGKFESASIPIHTELTTSVGKAKIGAIGTGKNLQSVVSLPTENGPWIIITAPAGINFNDLKQVLNSIRP